MIAFNKIHIRYLTGPLDYVVPTNPAIGFIKVVIPAGATTTSFDINIIDDKRLEGLESPEIIGISIYELSVPYGFILGPVSSANISIIDDDGKYNYLC